MVKNLSFVILLIALSFSFCKAQNEDRTQIMHQQITASAFTSNYSQYDGSPFFNDKWYEASLKLTGGEIYERLKVKVNIYEDELIYDNSVLNKYLKVDKFIVDEIYLMDTKGENELFIKNVCDSGDTNQCTYSYYFVHVTDSISLWSKSKKSLFKDNSTSANKIGYFELKTKYYTVINGELSSIPLLKNALAKKFPANKRAIVSYINQYHLDLKNPKHLSFLFYEINELEKMNPSDYR